MANSSDRPSPRDGLTLLELLIVVAIVASLVAMVLPAMRGPLSKSRLRSAAKGLSDALARARLEAIESGASWQFRYQPGTGRYEVAPRPASAPGTSLPFSTGGMGRSPMAAEPSVQREAVQSDLPEGVRFHGQESAALASDDPVPAGDTDLAPAPDARR